MSAGLGSPRSSCLVSVTGLQWVNAGPVLGAGAPRVAVFHLLCLTNNWDPSRASQISNLMLSGPRQDT